MTHKTWLVLAIALTAMGCEERMNEAAAEDDEPTLTGQEGMEGREETQRTGQPRGGQQQQQEQQQARIDVRSTAPFGQHLVDENGRTLYMFTADTRGERSACTDRCAQMWPPVLSRGEPRAANRAVRQDMLNTIRRDDGTMQVTYAGWPLYRFARDTRPGQAEGQTMEGMGGQWFMMAPSGERIEQSPRQAQADTQQGQQQEQQQREQQERQAQR